MSILVNYTQFLRKEHERPVLSIQAEPKVKKVREQFGETATR